MNMLCQGCVSPQTTFVFTVLLTVLLDFTSVFLGSHFFDTVLFVVLVFSPEVKSWGTLS
jgi:hypothetical protein